MSKKTAEGGCHALTKQPVDVAAPRTACRESMVGCRADHCGSASFGTQRGLACRLQASVRAASRCTTAFCNVAMVSRTASRPQHGQVALEDRISPGIPESAERTPEAILTRCLARTGPPLRMASSAASAGEVLPEAGQTAGGKPEST